MNELIDRLFHAMRCDLCVMAEYGDNENDLMEELKTADPDIIREYVNTWLGGTKCS